MRATWRLAVFMGLRYNHNRTSGFDGTSVRNESGTTLSGRPFFLVSSASGLALGTPCRHCLFRNQDSTSQPHLARCETLAAHFAIHAHADIDQRAELLNGVGKAWHVGHALFEFLTRLGFGGVGHVWLLAMQRGQALGATAQKASAF